MNNIAKSILLLLTLAGCTQLENNARPGVKTDMTFDASVRAWTKTNLEAEGKVVWNDSDDLSVFSSADLQSNECFRLQTTDGSTAAFSGKASTGEQYFAIYPYAAENKIENELLQLRIQPEQTAVAGGFQNRKCPAIAISDTHQLDFQNIASLVAFQMPETGDSEIIKAVLKGNDDEKLSGVLQVRLDRQGLEAEATRSSLSKVTLKGSLESGKTYYIVSLPQTFRKGVTLTLYNAEGHAFKVENKEPFTTSAGKITAIGAFEMSTGKDIRKIGDTYHIYNGVGLQQFAAIVNGGETAADAVLENDIDLDDIGNWDPIGGAKVEYKTVNDRTNTAILSGNAYKGCFDGNGKTISNLRISAEGAVIGQCTGLFGVLDQAEVKNLTLGKPGDRSGLTVRTSGSAMQETGVLAGLCHESRITDVTNHIKIDYMGTSTQRVTVGVIGSVHSDKKQSVLERVVNRADFSISCSGNSSNRWGTAIHAGGICGAAFSAFESGNNSSNKITFLSYCENYGTITSDAGRTAGIAGAAPYYAVLNSCFNHGNIISSNADGGYVSGMTVYMSTMSGMQDCINNGNITGTRGAGASGLVGLASYNNSNFSACANFGDIITDSPKRGVFVATNSASSRWLGCTAAGHLGTYNNNSIQFDSYPESLQIKYLGPGAEALTLDGIIYQMGATEIPEGPEAELRILFIGNSFTQDAVHLLPEILEGAGIKTVELGLMYWGGSIIQQHDEGYSSNSTNFTYYRKPTSVTDTWLQYKGYTLEDAVKEHPWDIITIQEHTGRPQSWIWNTTEKNAIDGLISKICQTQSGKKPEIWYIFSQAYHDLSKSSGVRDTFKSTEEHYAKIAAQARTISQEVVDLSGIIPTGTVLQNLRGSSLNNSLGLTRDGYHMDWSLSRYAAACAVYESLILPHFPDAVLEKNTFRTTESGNGRTPVTDQNRPLAINAARKAIEKPFEVSPIE